MDNVRETDPIARKQQTFSTDPQLGTGAATQRCRTQSALRKRQRSRVRTVQMETKEQPRVTLSWGARPRGAPASARLLPRFSGACCGRAVATHRHV